MFMSFLLLFTIEDTNALSTYVGVRIDNLTDDPAYSCAGEPGYGPQGRIRALASIYPTYPIYFNLSNSSGSTVWSGDDTANTDYTNGDIMYLPNSVDLTIGEVYNIFFDVDAYRIYLPLVTDGTFIASLDDNYYTIGTTITSVGRFQSSGCSYTGIGSWTGAGQPLVFDDRTLTESRGLYGGSGWFNIGSSYNGLADSDKGNFNVGFTMS